MLDYRSVTGISVCIFENGAAQRLQQFLLVPNFNEKRDHLSCVFWWEVNFL